MPSTDRTCEFPTVEPSRENPAGDCQAPATAATMRGNGRPLPLCPRHAARYPPDRLIPIEEVQDE
jgi:hypothetical protein